MTGDRRQTMAKGGRAVPVQTHRTDSPTPPDMEKKAVAGAAPPPPGSSTNSLVQAEAGGSATATSSEREEQCKKAKENLNVGTAVTVFGFSVLLGSVFFPKEARPRHPGNVRRAVSLLLSLATFLSGKALMLLSLNMLGRQVLVSGGHRVAAKCLVAACAVLSVLTLVSLLALLPGGVYLYAGLAVVTATMLAAAGTSLYLRRSTDGGGEAARYDDDEHKDTEELDAASKVTSCVTNSAFAGLVGVLFNASKISGGDAVDRAAAAAIFFMFATAILGMFMMTVSKITNRRCRRLLVTAIRLANALLLCSLACAALAAAFVVLRYRIFAAFAPLVVRGILCFLLRRCVVVGRHGGRDGGANLRETHEARIKAMEDIASKVSAAALAGIMSILGGTLGEKRHDKWGSVDVLMVVLTSAFVSGFGFMVLAAAPGSASALLAPVARGLLWSTVLLFLAAAVAVYGVEQAWTK